MELRLSKRGSLRRLTSVGVDWTLRNVGLEWDQLVLRLQLCPIIFADVVHYRPCLPLSLVYLPLLGPLNLVYPQVTRDILILLYRFINLLYLGLYRELIKLGLG